MGVDALKKSVEHRLLALIRGKRVGFPWFGLPHSLWSRARRGKGHGPGPLRGGGVNLVGLPNLNEKGAENIRIGNQLLFGVVRLCRAVAKFGISFAY
eukprot:6365836-Pyramimonas_sp.AAC.1